MAVKLRLDQLEKLARQSGYPSYHGMLHQLYVVERLSLTELQRRLHINAPRVRRHLVRFGITIRSRGGPNNSKVTLTPELLREVARDGVPAVADRLGISYIALKNQLRKVHA